MFHRLLIICVCVFPKPGLMGSNGRLCLDISWSGRVCMWTDCWWGSVRGRGSSDARQHGEQSCTIELRHRTLPLHTILRDPRSNAYSFIGWHNRYQLQKPLLHINWQQLFHNHTVRNLPASWAYVWWCQDDQRATQGSLWDQFTVWSWTSY